MTAPDVVPVRVELDRDSPVPLYHQIATALVAQIESGEVVPGQRIANEIALAEQLRVSRPTARRALQELVDRGMLVRKRGVGTQVAPTRVRRTVELTSLADDLESAGRRPRTTVLDYHVGPGAPEVTDLLEIPPGAQVLTLRRLRWADDEPLAVMTNHLPLALAPSYDDVARAGLYRLLRAAGVDLHMARQQIGARTATAAESRLLQDRPRAALLTMQRTAYDRSGRVVEHGDHLYRASRYAFSATLFA